MVRRIDFNADLGEGCGQDAAIAPWISSASVACAGHAGDARTIDEAVALCQAHDIAIGAHPGFEDRAHFGRRMLALPAADIQTLVSRQTERLAEACGRLGARLEHVKPHGALYALAARDAAVAAAIVHAVAGVDRSLRVYALAGSALVDAAHAAGLTPVQEVFAERRYQPDGQLRERSAPGAVIDTLDQALAQVRQMIDHGRIPTGDGTSLPVQAHTLCLHGDRPDAPDFARSLRQALQAAGIRVLAPGAAA